MIYNFDAIPDRRNSDSVKWNFYPEDVLPMWVADMDFRSPEPVLRAMDQRVEHGIFGYPINIPDIKQETKPGAATMLQEILAQHVESRFDWQVDPEAIVFVPGVVTGCNLACHMVADQNVRPGVLVQPPIYPPILHAHQSAGLLSQQATLTYLPDGSYEIDWDAFEAAITPETRLFILCNPHNPVGRVFRQEELRRMAEICLRHDVFICSDEIHGDLIYSGNQQTPIASLDPEIAGNTITLMAPSKTYNLPGLQFAFAIIPNLALRKRFLAARQGLVHWTNLMGMVAAQAAYSEGQEWLSQLIPYLEANRDFTYDFVQNELPGIRMAKPEGTYLAWLDCREFGIPGDPYPFFLEKGRVAFNDGATFGPGGEGFVRLNFGCPRATLEEGLARMLSALNQQAI